MSDTIRYLMRHRKPVSYTHLDVYKRQVLNINMISIAIGIVLFLTRIHLPEDINSTLSAVGGMIGPASMIVTRCV